MQRLLPFASMAFVILLGFASSADPILTLSTDEIALCPAPCSETTAIDITVDTNDTSLSSLTLTFSSLASGLEIVGISAGAGITPSGPALTGGDWEVSFGAAFGVDQTGVIAIGTLFLAGYVAGTPLVLLGTEYVTGALATIPITSMDVAFVIPEPGSLSLLGLGLIGMALRSRRQVK